jgi:NosR/NirI family nitrous oxide reductase transcriptional regulator
VHVFTFVHAAMREFHWETFLIDPMLFILWGFVALTLLLWGRGVYCGWLCPFGALQELLNQAARRLNVRQLEFPEVVHERLSAVKYLVLILLFGVSLQSTLEMVRYAEVEPFKTAITLRFQREWPFVLYAAGLVAVSLVNRKFFCKYLCPLGAALAIPGRFRVFDWWLRRRRECGRPCQTCARECEVRAIRPTGEINANECHYCLDCQVTYYNEAKCMPLVDRRTRHLRAARAREVVRAMEPHTGAQGLDDGERPPPA